MRYAKYEVKLSAILIVSASVAATLVATIAGCVQPQASELDRAADALAAGQYDTAVAAADTYLAREPAGERAAEALYLKGRAIEDEPASSADQARRNLQQAREAYVAAIKAGPKNSATDALIRSALADVAYWQDDYATASEQGLAAYANLADPAARAWTLYRAGVSQQRLGRFEEADVTLRIVSADHAGTEPANRAAARIGTRAFNVRVTNDASAVAQLKKLGYAVGSRGSASGAAYYVGPFTSYAQANAARTKLVGKYPGATVEP